MGMNSTRRVIVFASFAFLLLGLVRMAAAQQVTYYDFDAPFANPSQTSRTCTGPLTSPPGTPPSGAFFCFNDGMNFANPTYTSDIFPPSVDPILSDNPPVQGPHEAIQLTPGTDNLQTSMWFAVPQKVSTGFTSYFAFRITPNPKSYATADGLAFVIQNATDGGTDPATGCGDLGASGSGLGIVGGTGGCIGYGGIDNSLAIEFDTYFNGWDFQDIFDSPSYYDDNHIAVQNCGAGLRNSPFHNGPCLVHFNVNGVPTTPAINDQLPVTLADGGVHQVVVTYSGSTEAVPNLLQVYIDPPFVPGTHTPTSTTSPPTSTSKTAARLTTAPTWDSRPGPEQPQRRTRSWPGPTLRTPR
jgi:hypothetical protein